MIQQYRENIIMINRDIIKNMNMLSYLIPRKQACKEYNAKFGLTGTSKAIDVKLRSDLYNIIKENESIVKDYNEELTNG